MNPTKSTDGLDRLRTIKVGSSSELESSVFGNPLELAMSAATGRLLTDSLQEVTKNLQSKRRAIEKEVLEALLDSLPPTTLALQVNLNLHLRADHKQLNGFTLLFQDGTGRMEQMNLRAHTAGAAAPWKLHVRSAATQTWQAAAWQANVIQWLDALPNWPELVRTIHKQVLVREDHKMRLLLIQKNQIETEIQRASERWSHGVWELLQSGEVYRIQSDEVTSSSQLNPTPDDELFSGPYLELQMGRSTRIVVNTLRICHLSPSAKTCTVEGLRPALDLFESADGLTPFKKSMRTQHLKATLQAHVLNVWSAD